MAGERLIGRNGEIWRAWVGGETQGAMAGRYGITQGRVSQIIGDVRDGLEPEDRELIRVRESDVVDRVRLAAMTAMEDGALDPADRVAAGRLVLAASERAAKLFGLDAALRADVTVTGSEERTTQEAAAQAATYLHGGPEAG